MKRADKLHPAIQQYVVTDAPLTDVLRATSSVDEPVIHALIALQECLARKRLAKDAISAAQAVPVKETDPDLLVLMLSSWAELSCRIARPSEAEALIHRAEALLAERTPPEIRAAAWLVESILADTTGNKARCEKRLRDILALPDRSSPRLKFYIWELALFLARQGRLMEFETELQGIEAQAGPHFSRAMTTAVRFIDSVETGRARETDALEMDAGAVLPSSLPAATLSGYYALWRLMTVGTRSSEQDTPGPYAYNRPAWIEVVRALMERRTTDALRMVRSEASRLLGSFLGSGFESFNLIRAELAAGNAEAARRLLRMRESRGNTHYIHDLFFARVETLAGNQQLAARHFADVLNAVDRYRARGRLDFELQLAGEMGPGGVIGLTRQAEALAQTPAPRRTAHRDASASGAGATRGSLESIIGRSSATAHIRDMILRFADADAPVLVTGETGTGKELVSRALHESSRRRSAPFIAVNCGSIAESLLDSELFGHQRGAFTGADRTNKGLFEEAGEGTLLLDEMGEILPRLQKALLRVLETGEIRAVGSTTTRRIRCRILAATNADLNRLAEEGQFRKDLLYRLQRLGIHIPPLRERREDIAALAQHFMDSGRAPGMHASLSPDLIRVLEDYDWPGNVRELKNVVERMRLMHSDKLVYRLSDLDLKFHASPAASEPTRIPLPAGMADSDALRRRRWAGESKPSPTRGAPERPAAHDDGREVDAESLLRDGRSRLRREDRLLELFRRYRKLTRSEIVEIMRVSPNTATKDLRTLCEAGTIERVEPSASTRSHYFILKEDAARGRET